MNPGTCALPPEGWYCNLEEEHGGPCPTHPRPATLYGRDLVWCGGYSRKITWREWVAIRVLGVSITVRP